TDNLAFRFDVETGEFVVMADVELWDGSEISGGTTDGMPNAHMLSAAGNSITAAALAADAIAAIQDGLSTLDAAGVRDAIGLTAADLDDKFAALPTQADITGGAYALDTDSNGRIRIVDGTGAGELSLTGGLID